MHQNFVALVVHDSMRAVTWPVTKARVRASKPLVYQSFADPSFGFDRRAVRATVITSERLYAPINVAIPATFETPAKSGISRLRPAHFLRCRQIGPLRHTAN